MILKTATEVVRITTSTAAPIDVQANFADHTDTTFTPSSLNTKITAIGTTTIIGSPASGQRQVKDVMIHNVSTSTSNAIAVEVFDGTNAYKVFNFSLTPDEHVQYNGQDWVKYNRFGVEVVASPEPIYPIKSHVLPIQKNSVGTSEASGIYHFMGTGTGVLPAWAIGTSGLAGRAVLGTEAGFLKLPTTSNKLSLVKNTLKNSIGAASMQLVDVLFVNNGLVVTTTTAQTVNTVALPTRDNNGTALGAGCIWGILVTTATTNAGAIANMTFSYTNELGVAGRSGTVTSFPATATVGSFIQFNLQAGDKSIQSIQTVTFGTSLVAGAVSLVCVRIIDTVSTVAANLGDYIQERRINIVGNEALTVMLLSVTASAYVIPPSEIILNEY